MTGEPPTTLSPKYKEPITVRKTGALRICFIAMAPMLADSNEAWIDFTIMNQVPSPQIFPPAGRYKQHISVEFVGAAPLETIKDGERGRATSRGSARAEASESAGAGSKTRMAGGGRAGVATVSGHAQQLGAEPGGSADRALIFFSLNGQTPVPSSEEYSLAPHTHTRLFQQPLHLSRIDNAHFEKGAPLENFTRDPNVPLRLLVCAVAAQKGLIDSVETSSEIEILAQVSAPRCSPEPRMYTEVVDITIDCATPGATIYYTLDGSDPRAGVAGSPAHSPAHSPSVPSSPSSPAPHLPHDPQRDSPSSAASGDSNRQQSPPSPTSSQTALTSGSVRARFQGVKLYTGPIRITQVGYTRVRAVAVKQDMWGSDEVDCEYGVEAQVH
jgi:hypothetical protein